LSRSCSGAAPLRSTQGQQASPFACRPSHDQRAGELRRWGPPPESSTPRQIRAERRPSLAEEKEGGLTSTVPPRARRKGKREGAEEAGEIAAPGEEEEATCFAPARCSRRGGRRSPRARCNARPPGHSPPPPQAMSSSDRGNRGLRDLDPRAPEVPPRAAQPVVPAGDGGPSRLLRLRSMKLLPALLRSSSRRSAKDSGRRQMGREEEERQWEGKEEEEARPAAVEMQRGGESPQECSSTRVGSHFAELVAVAAGAATVAFRYSFCRCRSGCSACWRQS
jgi:hypothetical protein